MKINNGEDFMGLFKDYDDCQVNKQLLSFYFNLTNRSK